MLYLNIKNVSYLFSILYILNYIENVLLQKKSKKTIVIHYGEHYGSIKIKLFKLHKNIFYFNFFPKIFINDIQILCKKFIKDKYKKKTNKNNFLSYKIKKNYYCLNLEKINYVKNGITEIYKKKTFSFNKKFIWIYRL